jgi:hypothetical protein
MWGGFLGPEVERQKKNRNGDPMSRAFEDPAMSRFWKNSFHEKFFSFSGSMESMVFVNLLENNL